ncbi:hypothetical protein AAHN97_24770 [Chitinophaga niabensis]|uniref:hypothetical protein n=1 Tax=Chitinophaga niabensis TaxID=536979 RepID=UPI0031B9EC77
MSVLSQPKKMLLIISLLIIIVGGLTADFTLDFQLYDTYFIVSNFQAGIFVGGFLLLQTVIYFLTDRYRQSRSLQYFHVISTGMMFLAGSAWQFYIQQRPIKSGDVLRLLDDAYFWWAVASVFLFLFIPGQILFIINLIAGFIRGKKVLNHVR